MRMNKSFNPLPAFGPGDTSGSKNLTGLINVSIRSRLLGREIRYAVMMKRLAIVSFNPLPAFGPGDTKKIWWLAESSNVSIRSRLLGREIRRLQCNGA